MMEIANCMVALGGDSGNQVPKYGVTAAEIAVLRVIHGDDAVTEIEPAGSVQRSNRDERSRLLGVYGKFMDGREIGPVSALFPGAAARVFESLDELEVPEAFYKAETRVKPNAANDDAPRTAHPLDHDEDGRKGGSKKGRRSKKIEETADEPASDEPPANDGISDMDDSVLG